MCLAVKDILYNKTNVALKLNFYKIWTIDCSNDHKVEKILDWLYEDSRIFLKRKYNNYLKIKKRLREPKCRHQS